MKNFFANTSLVFAALALTLVAVELVARQFIGVPAVYTMDPGNTVYDKRGFWSLAPGYKGEMGNDIDFTNKSLVIDDIGSRHIPCGSSNDGSNGRVFLIGDSQTFGWGVSNDETWANQAQCILNDEIPNPPKLLNFGVPGTQVDQYFSRTEHQILPALNPGDIVVVSLTWNDLISFYLGDQWVANQLKRAGLKEVDANSNSSVTVEALAPAPLIQTQQQPKPIEFQMSSPKRVLDKPTWRYNFYKKYGIFVPNISSLANTENSLIHMSAAFRYLWSSARLLFYRVRPSDSFFDKVGKNSSRHNFLSLKALANRLERRGAKVIIQFLPNRVFFDDFYYRSYSKNGIVYPEQDYFWHVGRPFCISLQLDCVNRFQNLKTNVRDAHTFAFDGHYNEIATKQIGNALAGDLIKSLHQIELNQ